MNKRAFRWSPALLVAALSPALLHLGNCGDPHLFSLEVEADSMNRVVGFAKQTHSYNVWTAGGDTIVVRATTSEPSASVNRRLFIDGVFQDFQPLGTGGGEVTLTIPPSVASELELDVNHNGEIGRYTLNINPACTADECDDANQCTSDTCNAAACDFTMLPGGTTCDLVAVGDGLCEAGVCVGDGLIFQDDFDDGVLDLAWIRLTPCLVPIETGGQIVMQKGSSCVGGGTLLYGQQDPPPPINGDFEMTLDFALPSFSVPLTGGRFATLQVRKASDSTFVATIERYNTYAAGPVTCAPSTTSYKAYTTTSVNCDPSVVWLPTADAQGSFRIARQGALLTMSYWGGTQWEELHSATVTSEDLKVYIYAASGGGDDGPFDVRFDNFLLERL